MDMLIVKNENKYEEYPLDKGSGKEKPFQWHLSKEGKSFLVLKGKGRTYQRPGDITIAAQAADIIIEQLPFRIVIQKDQLLIEKTKESKVPIYLNAAQQNIAEGDNRIAIKDGDILLIETTKIILFPGQLVIKSDWETTQINLLEEAPKGEIFEGFPRYKRSPRIIKRVPTEEIKVENPPEKEQMNKTGLVQIIVTPLIMLSVTVAMSILMKRGIYVLMSVTTTIVSIIVSVAKFIQERKANKEKNKNRQTFYEQYLLDTRKKIYKAKREEEEAYLYNNPSIKDIETMINGYNSRIYERSINDEDFIKINLGSISTEVSFKISIDYKELELERDSLEQEAKDMKDGLSTIQDKPVAADLKRAHIGLVGEKDIIHEQLKIIVSQLAFFHSYHELQIINIYDAKYNDDFMWMRWFPHLKLHAINVYGNVNSEKMRDQVLGSLHQIIKDRKLKVEESKKEARFLPHYIFIIDEPKLIMDHSIMEYLGKEGDNLGFSIIYTTHLRANLPENIGTVFMLNTSEEGNLLLEQKEIKNIKIKLNRAGNVNFEKMARNISVLIHEQGITSQIPESITFFQMYGIEHPGQLQVGERWKKSESHKSLAVPLGVRAADDYLYLNLHEKAHGPHGLVAGTTGSGKSEIVQSYILSLGVNFHPYEVGFLLIDYKGGGMAGLFKDMPHLLGTITNLDGSESMRAMASIKSELARRQRIFSENNVNHINSYNKLFRLGEVSEPIPHLFLISDEFAELKKEQPEFMTELVSAARIGRSLGIHLILATQKPSGVVDDQIWTNSRFKLALKVQNEADSKEILKTPDAAFITQPGRAYLQVGNNEIYELFQSAWSGATYTEDTETETVDDRVYVINDLGQGELVNGETAAGGEVEQIKDTQLDVVVKELKKVFEALHIPQVKRPWLPPLQYRILSPYTVEELKETAENKENSNTKLDLTVPVGMVDIPEEQNQCEFCVNLLKDGNTAFFSSAGYGKSTFLTTFLLTLAVKNTVDNLNFYIFDFGNNALIPLNALPHTADYIIGDDSERLGKFMRIMAEEIKDRKRLFAENMVQNFDVYNQSSDKTLKTIIVAIDNYDIVKELGTETEEFFTKLSRDGMGLGIYMVITGSRMGSMKFSAVNNYKNKIAGYMLDASEVNSIVGRSTYKPVEIEGRALVKVQQVNPMQIYTMVHFKNEIEYNANLKLLVSRIKEMYPSKRAPRIPVLPENFTSSMLADYVCNEERLIRIGLHKGLVEVRGFRRSMSPFVILGDGQKGKTNLLKVMIMQARKQGKVYLLDSKNKELYFLKEKENVIYINDGDDLEEMLEDVSDLCEEKQEEFKEVMESGRGGTPKMIYEAMEPCFIFIDDLEDLLEKYANQEKEIFTCFKNAAECGIGIITSIHSNKAKGFGDLTKWFKAATAGVVVGNQGNSNILPLIPNRDIPVLGEGLALYNGAYERVLLPLYDGGKNGLL